MDDVDTIKNLIQYEHQSSVMLVITGGFLFLLSAWIYYDWFYVTNDIRQSGKYNWTEVVILAIICAHFISGMILIATNIPGLLNPEGVVYYNLFLRDIPCQ